MEIAGSRCTGCGQKIVLAREGKICRACGRVVHQACDAQFFCPHCGTQYEVFEAPRADVSRDAILPRSLRPSRDASPVAFVLLALFVVAVGLAFFLFLRRIC